MNLQFTSPMMLALAAAASIWVTALHFISFRVPEPLPLPTARFVPSGRTRKLAARVAPSDIRLLLLRIVALALAGLALAGPTLRLRMGTALVVVADVSRAVADRGEVRDSVAALMRAGRSISVVSFDSVARLSDPSELVNAAAVPDAPGDLASALLLAIREGERLRSRFDSVSIVVVSPLVAEEDDVALSAIRNTWGGEMSHVRVAAATGPDDNVEETRVLPAPGDAAGAAVRAALTVRSAKALRVVRVRPGPADSAFARSGGLVLFWPADSVADGLERPAAVLAIADGTAAVVRRSGNAVVASAASTVLRWDDGGVAAATASVGAGCIRSIAPGIVLHGDEPLRPAFMAVVRSLVAPCRRRDYSPMSDPGRLASFSPLQLPPLPPVPSPSLVRALVLLSLAVLLVEWWLRSRLGGPARERQGGSEAT